MRSLAIVLGTLCLLLGGGGPAQAALAPGLFGGHPPAGRVLPDNTLTFPQGRPRGVVMVIHGGGWVFTGPAAVHPATRRPLKPPRAPG